MSEENVNGASEEVKESLANDVETANATTEEVKEDEVKTEEQVNEAPAAPVAGEVA